MSEGNERNLESVAPEAAENIQTDIKETAEPVEAPVAQDDDRENAPRQSSEPEKKDRKKRGRRKNILLPMVLALMAALVILGALVGYGIGRMRSIRNAEQAEAVEEQPADTGEPEIQAYDAFTEELTRENQQALDFLSGADGYFDEGADALRGEDEVFADELTDGEGEVPAVESVVVAEYGDGQVLMSDEVLEEYNEQLTMYILSGYSEEEIAETLLDEVLQTMVGERVLAEHARELGLYDLTDDDRAEIEAEAAATYADYVEYYRSNVLDTRDMTDEEATAAARDYLLEYEGINYENLVAEIGEGWWEQKLYDQITAGVTIGDAAVQADYAQRIEEQKADFAEYPDDFEFTQMNGGIIVYNLPGYRAVKMLLLDFEDDEAAMAVYTLTDELANLEAEGDAENAKQDQAKVDAYYAEPETRAKEALEQLRAGADMDEMLLTIGADEGMKNERQRSLGYYVSAESTLWSADFVAAAMGLKNVGDYSEPVRTKDGVCILQYIGDVTEGEVPLADVRDALAEETLDLARYEAYVEQLETWLEEANPSYYPERMQ